MRLGRILPQKPPQKLESEGRYIEIILMELALYAPTLPNATVSRSSSGLDCRVEEEKFKSYQTSLPNIKRPIFVAVFVAAKPPEAPFEGKCLFVWVERNHHKYWLKQLFAFAFPCPAGSAIQSKHVKSEKAVERGRRTAINGFRRGTVVYAWQLLLLKPKRAQIRFFHTAVALGLRLIERTWAKSIICEKISRHGERRS